ncbi:FAD synthetase [Drechmeria coniospora]|uniref:FAD synthase n=1 Tax=Drechmeria coniospora TaxID=98403 RepID=A0A151GNZ5_DRECN|nr:FAD synthetase [Drechmeria coniospora]KYK58810.1 FAD synthetase [Drechmeria coniospora]
MRHKGEADAASPRLVSQAVWPWRGGASNDAAIAPSSAISLPAPALAGQLPCSGPRSSLLPNLINPPPSWTRPRPQLLQHHDGGKPFPPLAMIHDDGRHAPPPANLALNGAPAKSDFAARPLRDVCLRMGAKVDAFLAQEPESELLRNVRLRLRASVEVVAEALDKYSPDQISLSYNGGKDCLVLLVIILACLARRMPAASDAESDAPAADGARFPDTFQAVYVVSDHPFPEMDAFVASSAAEYHLQVTRYTIPMRSALELYLADRPSIRAIFVGTRRTDPHGEKLSHFDHTDAGWPPFMRVHPVIDWHYGTSPALDPEAGRGYDGRAEVADWTAPNSRNLGPARLQARSASATPKANREQFIRHLGISYCPLYDQGYTSLGGRTDTHPNPHLKRAAGGGGGGEGFRPAYELTDDDEERLGRDR